MIPQTVIDKLRLQLTTDTIGVSFLHKARIFKWPALTDAVDTVYVMECDLEGVPVPEGKTMILARWPRAFKSMMVDNSVLEMYDQRTLAGIMHKELQKKQAIAHDWRAGALKNRRS